MTSRDRDRQADRRAVFDRDEHSCGHCGATGDAGEPTALRTYPVGDVPQEGAVHESSLATVCTDCFETLGADAPASAAVSSEELFRLVRETTRVQGGAISDVASFASLATSLPTTLAEAEGEDDDESDADPAADTAAEYRDGRRGVLLALDVADADLERVRAVDGAAFDDEVRSSLATVAETATELQSTLREVVALAETVPAGLERCRGCFDPLEGDACPTCGLEPRETADWEDDGDVAFDRLFSSINDGLQDASTTTEALTDRTMTLASRLTES